MPERIGRRTSSLRWLPDRLDIVAVLAISVFAIGARLPGTVGVRIGSAELTFVALFVESLPFLLVGALLSTGLRGRLGQPLLRAAVRRPRLAAVLAPVVGVGLPICDCGLLPIARDLRTAGGGRAVTTFLAGAPLTNPVVIVTTLIAFPGSPAMAVGRLVAGIAVAMAVGFLAAPPPIPAAEVHSDGELCSAQPPPARVLPAIGVELAQTAPALVIGAMLAATVKAIVPAATFTAWQAHPLLAALAMMLLAFVMSICSQADAFVAASLPVGPLPRLAFLVMGPVLDLRLGVLYRREFGTRWVLGYAGIVVPAIFGVVVVLATLGVA